MLKIQMIGNLTRDAQMKKSNNGKSFASFTVAINEKRGGEKQTHYVDCTWFVDETSNVVKYMTKGVRVFVLGRPEASYFVNRNTSETTPVLRCIVNEMELLGSSQQQEAPQPATQPQPVAHTEPQPTSMAQAQGFLQNNGFVPTDDPELPF